MAGDGRENASWPSLLKGCGSESDWQFARDRSARGGVAAGIARDVGEIELPLFREVMAYYDGNQSKAAAALGLNRATLRKKLQLHGLI